MYITHLCNYIYNIINATFLAKYFSGLFLNATRPRYSLQFLGFFPTFSPNFFPQLWGALFCIWISDFRVLDFEEGGAVELGGGAGIHGLEPLGKWLQGFSVGQTTSAS